MKLSIYQLAQLAGWYADFDAATQSKDSRLILMQFGVLSGILDGIYPGHEPSPRDMSPPEFIQFVTDALPLAIAQNAPMLKEFTKAARTFSETMAAIVKVPSEAT